MNYKYVKNFLEKVGFQVKDVNKFNININNYIINVEVKLEDDNTETIIDSSISYGNKILVEHGGITNLSKRESLVQLECVCRLLKKGYKPENIELEKTYRLGHKDKGRLDVLLKKME